MVDMDHRADLLKHIYKRLVNPKFRQLLQASPSGEHHIIVALPDDLLEGVIHDVNAAGGSANVFVPVLNGLAIFCIEATQAANSDAPLREDNLISADCTVGVFLERVRLDGGGDYAIFIQGRRHTDSGSARLMALAE